jgi:hypothetical protein
MTARNSPTLNTRISSASLRTAGISLQQQQLYPSSNKHNTALSNHDVSKATIFFIRWTDSLRQNLRTNILNSLITVIHKICANFTSPDEESSSFRNVVIIQCDVVFVTLWEKVLYLVGCAASGCTVTQFHGTATLKLRADSKPPVGCRRLTTGTASKPALDSVGPPIQ